MSNFDLKKWWTLDPDAEAASEDNPLTPLTRCAVHAVDAFRKGNNAFPDAEIMPAIKMSGSNGYIFEQKRDQIGTIDAKAPGDWPNWD